MCSPPFHFMNVSESGEANTSLTPFPAPHYPPAVLHQVPTSSPPLPHSKKKKKKEGRHPSPLPTKYHQWKETESGRQPAPSTSWGSCPVPAQFQTMMDVLWGTLYFLLWSPALGFDRPNPTGLMRSAKNLHLRLYRCSPTTQKEYTQVCRINLLLPNKITLKKKLNPHNPTNPNSITCTDS